MTLESGWEDLAKQFEQIPQGPEPYRVDWFVYVGCEDQGLWSWHPDGSGTEMARATFGLIAARAIKKLGIAPRPIPKSSEYFPAWRLYGETKEEFFCKADRHTDLTDAVLLGLGVAGREAFDPCSRAWIEILRKNSPAFQCSENEDMTIKGQNFPSLSGTITNVCEASAAYCLQLERDEIRAELMARPLPKPPSKVGGRSSVSGPSKRPITGAIEFDYPDFPEGSCDRVKREEIQAAREFNSKLGSAHSEKDLRALRITCIMRPTKAICWEAMRFGWGAHRVDSLRHEFVETAADWAALTLNGAAREEIEASPEWSACLDELLALDDSASAGPADSANDVHPTAPQKTEAPKERWRMPLDPG